MVTVRQLIIHCDRCGVSIDEEAHNFTLRVGEAEDPVLDSMCFDGLIDLCVKCEQSFHMFMAQGLANQALEKARKRVD